MRLDKTSNPAFSNYFWDDNNQSSQTMSVSGIVIKSLVLIVLIALITAGIWKLHNQGYSVKWFTTGGMLAAIIISIIISVRQH